MNCNCIETIEARIKDLEIARGVKVITVQAQNQSCIFDGPQGYTTLSTPMQVIFEHTVKRTGATKTSTRNVDMLISYCPFCGKPVKPEDAGKSSYIELANMLTPGEDRLIGTMRKLELCPSRVKILLECILSRDIYAADTGVYDIYIDPSKDDTGTPLIDFLQRKEESTK